MIQIQYLLILGIIAASTVGFKWFSYIESLPTEFEISGKIDHCCCDAELIKDVNRRVVDITDKLTETYFFRIFRVNLNNECPFWAQELLCKNPGQCTVCQCDEHEVPLLWRFQKTSPVSTTEQSFSSWETSKRKNIEWHVEDKENDRGTYVDLKKNPEKFTGYQGQRIWNTIYSENCFKGSLEEMCHEERLLYRIVSGLHTSISTQLSEYYGEKNNTQPNIDLFFEKVGNHPDRISNLYFAYSVMLRAINRAQHYIQNYTFETGEFKSDIETRRLINHLYDVTTKNCDHPFDESELFSDITNDYVKERFVTYFHNISRLLDCVECEVCKVYSKLQTYGIAAALKILFSEKLGGEKEISLKRNELIALVNTFNKFSTSISYIDKMFERRKQSHELLTQYIGYGGVILIIVFLLGYRLYNIRKFKPSNVFVKGSGVKRE